MRREALLLLWLVIKAFSIYSPGVEVTLTRNKLRFECKDRKYFQELKFLDSDFNEIISSFEFINCLKNFGHSTKPANSLLEVFREYYGNEAVNSLPEKSIFAVSKPESIEINSNMDIDIVWHANTLNHLKTLILTYNYYSTSALNEIKALCKTVSARLQLDKFKDLKRLELTITGKYDMCRKYTFDYSKL